MAYAKYLAERIFGLLPPRNRLLYRACQKYVDRFNGDNNSDPLSNGEARLLQTELPKLRGGVVFDIGANVGNWAEYAISVEPTIELHCFEPSHETFVQLSTRQWPDNVYLNNVGLGETDEHLELNIVDSGSGLNSLHARHGVDVAQVKSKETVSITTVDAYCQANGVETIQFLKVDVEGHELAVFRGMEHTLSQRRVRMIQFEYGGCNLDARVHLADIWGYLEPFGFTFHKIYPDGPKAIATYSQALETFRYANYIAKRI